MKIFDNGVIRDMTPEEINIDRMIDAEMSKQIAPKDVIEEFIDRLSEANSFLDIIKIAKDIKSRKK